MAGTIEGAAKRIATHGKIEHGAMSRETLAIVQTKPDIPTGLVFVTCPRCGERTCARSENAQTLRGWTAINLSEGRATCPACNGSRAEVRAANSVFAGYWAFVTTKQNGRVLPACKMPTKVFTTEAYRHSAVRIYPALPTETAAEARAVLVRMVKISDRYSYEWTDVRREVTRWVGLEKPAHIEQAESLFGDEEMESLEVA